MFRKVVLRLFTKILHIYKNKAIYGLALAKLKQKDYKGCKAILLTIPSDYEDSKKVQELLGKLD